VSEFSVYAVRTVRCLDIASKGIDPIEVYFRDEEPGQGSITITCYGEAWTAWWGAIGGRTIDEFVAQCDADYLLGKLTPPRHTTKRQNDHLRKIIERVLSVLAAMRTTEAAS
jgi:hypothetical protein